MPTSPLTGSRFPDSTYTPAIWTWIEQAVRDIEDNTSPYYATATARDNAYAAWVAQGNAMRNGLECYVNGVGKMIYENDAWHSMPTTNEVRMMRAQRNVDTAIASGSWLPFASNTNWGEIDTYGMRTSGATWIAPWTGWYQLIATIYFEPNATGARGLRLQPLDGQGIGEGAGQPYELVLLGASPSPHTFVVTGSHITDLIAGQRVQLEAYQSSGASLIVRSVRMSAMYAPNVP